MIYIVLGIGVLYLSSHIINMRKVPKSKRRYLIILDAFLVVGLSMGVLGILFPAEASGRLAMITALAIIFITLVVVGYLLYKVKKENKNNTN